jgi:hypothetical protein
VCPAGRVVPQRRSSRAAAKSSLPAVLCQKIVTRKITRAVARIKLGFQDPASFGQPGCAVRLGGPGPGSAGAAGSVSRRWMIEADVREAERDHLVKSSGYPVYAPHE